MPFSGNDFRKWINENPGKVIGMCSGALLGVALFVFAVWKVLLILLLVVAGYLIGRSYDENIALPDLIRKILRRD